MSNSLNLNLPYVQEAQAQKHVTVNDALRRIDSVVQLTVVDRSSAAPPPSPSEGERYIVAPGGSGAWAGHDKEVAAYADGAWVFFTPREGWLAFVTAEAALAYYTGSAWELLTAAAGYESTAKLGINAAADTVNRLVVRSDAVLFAPDLSQANPTGDTRVVVSKEATGDTASHLFQTNFSGRAEFGLIGSDDFTLKVSADGSSFTDAFSVDRANGRVDFAEVPAIGGTNAFLFSVPSRAALATTRVPASVQQVETRGYDGENDLGGGRYRRVSTLPADGLGITDLNGGHWALEGGVVDVRQAGAKGDGATNDTAAINRATQSGRNVRVSAGTYLVTSPITTGGVSQRIEGDGRGRTRIKVNGSFAMGGAGVFRIDHSFVSLSDIEIDFDQSTASSRATLRAYPPAVHMVGQTRCRLARLRFLAAYDGVDATGNTGGAILDDIECGSFNVGFRFGGALDSVEMNNCRVWPYNFAGDATLLGIYQDGQTIGFRIGHIDDFKLSNSTPWRARLIIEATAGKRPFGLITGLSFDGPASRLEMSDGEITISGLYATTQVPNDFFIRQTGGDLAISDFDFDVSDDANSPMVEVAGPTASCQLQNGKCGFALSTLAEGVVLTAGQLTASNIRFSVNPSVVRTGACIRQTGGDLVAFGNTCNGVSTGSGPFIKVTTNGNHAIFGNDSNGWRYEFPADKSNGLYGPNHDGGQVHFDSALMLNPVSETSTGGQLKLKGPAGSGTATLDNSSGNVRILSLASGKTFQVHTAEGVALLSGRDLYFTTGLQLWRGAADEVRSTGAGQLSLGSVTSGTANTAFGRRTLTAVTSGSQNTGCGTDAGAAITGSNGNTMIGYAAGSTISSGNGNTGLGRNAFTGVSFAVNNATAVGDGTTVTGSNQVQLGNSSTTTYAYGAVQNRSDARDKADVRDTVLGLAFLRRLRPVDFRWNYREDYERPHDLNADAEWVAPPAGSKTRVRYHHGLLAQEVEAAMQELGVDFGGYQDHALAGGRDVKSIGYTELIGPLVKAVQELCARLEALERNR